MKKIITLLVAAMIFGSAAMVSAQQVTMSQGGVEGFDSYAETSTQVIQVEDKYGYLHPKRSNPDEGKKITMEIHFTPLTNDVIFYYTCMAADYEQGEAMNTAMAVFEDFAAENKFKHYNYTAKDKSKYFKDGRGIRMATYISRVHFSR